MTVQRSTRPAIWVRISRHSLTRFAVFGVAGLAFDVTLLWSILHWTTMPQSLAVTLAFVATYAVNFALNRRFSFRAGGSVGAQLARFAPQVCLDYALTLTAVDLMTGWGLGVVQARVLAGGTNATANYLLYRFWTFAAPGRPD